MPTIVYISCSAEFEHEIELNREKKISQYHLLLMFARIQDKSSNFDLSLTFQMVYKTLLYLSKLSSYRLLKTTLIYTVYISFPMAKAHFDKGRKVYCVFINKHLMSMKHISLVFGHFSLLSAKMLPIFYQYGFLE